MYCQSSNQTTPPHHETYATRKLINPPYKFNSSSEIDSRAVKELEGNRHIRSLAAFELDMVVHTVSILTLKLQGCAQNLNNKRVWAKLQLELLPHRCLPPFKLQFSPMLDQTHIIYSMEWRLCRKQIKAVNSVVYFVLLSKWIVELWLRTWVTRSHWPWPFDLRSPSLNRVKVFRKNERSH